MCNQRNSRHNGFNRHVTHWIASLSQIEAFKGKKYQNYLTPWSRLIFEKIILAQLVEKYSLSCSQTPMTGPYPEPAESNLQCHTLFLEDPFNTVLPSTPSCPKRSPPFRFSEKKKCFSHLPFPTHCILLDLMTLVMSNFRNSTNYETPRYVVFSIFLSVLHP
jgi:hypothetical protein